MRRKLGLTRPDSLVVVEECEGRLFLRPALPTRNLPKKQVAKWIERDEAEMAAFRVAQRPRKSSPGRSGLTG
jgi:bifunctional DNA-binding transcriptional regulator/antitoxin component of YhaV-PrlF toxin-antitoxin module